MTYVLVFLVGVVLGALGARFRSEIVAYIEVWFRKKPGS